MSFQAHSFQFLKGIGPGVSRCPCPRSPFGPGGPRTPGSPLAPSFPFTPAGPITPGGPWGPIFPGFLGHLLHRHSHHGLASQVYLVCQALHYRGMSTSSKKEAWYRYSVFKSSKRGEIVPFLLTWRRALSFFKVTSWLDFGGNDVDLENK